MPVVEESSRGLRRYAVFSFAEDTESQRNGRKGGRTDLARRFPASPLTAAAEVAGRLAHTELFHMKRLRSIEAAVDFPFLDVTFFSTYEPLANLAQLLDKEDCLNLHNPSIPLQKALYEELQLVDPKRDMITTPIDASEASEPSRRSAEEAKAAEEKKLRGYITLAFKTKEDMYSRDFAASWKTWTGVRYICMALPRALGLRRISFYRKIGGTSEFVYVLVIEISNLLVYAPQTLNLMDRLRLRLCGFTGIYREVDFHLDHATAGALDLPTSAGPPQASRKVSRDLDEPLIVVHSGNKRATGRVKTLPADDDTKRRNSRKLLQPSREASRETSPKPSQAVAPSPKKRDSLRVPSPAPSPQPPSPQPRKLVEVELPVQAPVERKPSVEVVVRPLPAYNTIQPSRFVGQGRICQQEREAFLQGPPIEMSSGSPGGGSLISHSSLLDQRRRSLIAGPTKPRPRHNVVADLPTAKEALHREASGSVCDGGPSYQSIFKRQSHGYMPLPQADFGSIAAEMQSRHAAAAYNSPVFSRKEWGRQSALYQSSGADTMEELAQSLENPPPLFPPPPLAPPHQILPPFEEVLRNESSFDGTLDGGSLDGGGFPGFDDELGPEAFHLHHRRTSIADPYEAFAQAQAQAEAAAELGFHPEGARPDAERWGPWLRGGPESRAEGSGLRSIRKRRSISPGRRSRRSFRASRGSDTEAGGPHQRSPSPFAWCRKMPFV